MLVVHVGHTSGPCSRRLPAARKPPPPPPLSATNTASRLWGWEQVTHRKVPESLCPEALGSGAALGVSVRFRTDGDGKPC